MPVRKKRGESVLAVPLGRELHEKLRLRAEREERTIKYVVKKALEAYLKTAVPK